MHPKKLTQTLEEIKKINKENQEYWSARELYPILGYTNWLNFKTVIEKAIESCKATTNKTKDHFDASIKMVEIGSETKREVKDYNLTRYACYLIAQNGNPRIPEIAFAQMYFAMQTRKQEDMENQMEDTERLIARKQLIETEKEFAKTAFEEV